jgi:thiol-disulfide isomerase/thioredoxin
MKTRAFGKQAIGYIVALSAYVMFTLAVIIIVSGNLSDMESLPDEAESYSFGSVDLSKLSNEDRQYLGLAGDAKPILKNIEADLVIVEFMSVYCSACQMQASIFNQLHSEMEKDSALRSRVKIVVVAVGNNQREVSKFRKGRETVSPILPDPKFTVYERLANSMRVPYTMLLRKAKNDDIIPVSSYKGLIRSYESLLQEIKAALQYDEDILRLKQGEVLADDAVERTELKISEGELAAKLREIMIKTSGDENIAIKTVSLPDGRRVYEGDADSDGKHVRYLAVVVSRESICNICHAIQFMYVLDETGRLAGFEPIYLTKYGNGNETWDEKDVEKIRRRVLGRSVLQSINFDPEVDAVTSATITSAIIFHEFAQGKKIYRFVIPPGK